MIHAGDVATQPMVPFVVWVVLGATLILGTACFLLGRAVARMDCICRNREKELSPAELVPGGGRYRPRHPEDTRAMRAPGR